MDKNVKNLNSQMLSTMFSNNTTTENQAIKIVSTVINNNLDNFMKPEVEKCGKVWRTKRH